MRSLLPAALVAATLGTGLLTACSGDIGEPETESPSGGDSSSSGGNPVSQAIKPGPAGMRALTGRQYVGSIRVLLGDAAAKVADDLVAKADPKLDAPLKGYVEVGASSLSIQPTEVEELESFARTIADSVIQDPKALQKILPCTPPIATDLECHKQFVTSFGRVAWRRPLTGDEVALMTNLAQAAANDPDVTQNNFNEGIRYALMGFLQSPYFLYRIELGDEAATDPA